MSAIDPATTCREYPGLCTETEPGHFDHSNHEHRVRDKQGETILDVGFVQVSDGGPAVIYIGGLAHEDYAPEEVHTKTAEIRALLDQADQMADQLLGRRAHTQVAALPELTDDDGMCPACDTTDLERCAACGSCRCDRHDNCVRPATRCPAAHREDPTPCSGPPTVTVLDATNAGADGCEHHAARLLASLEGGRVYRLPGAIADGAAIRVFQAAADIRPFPWLENAPRTLPSQLSHAENREAHTDPWLSNTGPSTPSGPEPALWTCRYCDAENGPSYRTQCLACGIRRDAYERGEAR